MFTSTLIGAFCSARYSKDEVKDLLEAAAADDHSKGQMLRSVGAAARAEGKQPALALASRAVAELPWKTFKLSSGPGMPPLLCLFGWPQAQPGANALLDMGVQDLKNVLLLAARCDADLAMDVIRAVEEADATAMGRVVAALAQGNARDRAHTTIASHGERAARVSIFLRAGLSTLKDELAFISTTGGLSASTHAHVLAAKHGVAVSAARAASDNGIYAHAVTHRPVLELIQALAPDLLWDHVATYVGSPWWNNNWRVDWLVGGLPWEESLHVVGDDEVWHGRRAGSAVVVCGGSRKKKGSSSFKLHKTTALAEKDLKSKAEAAKGKLGVAPAARPDAPKSAGELLLQGADYGDRYLVASMLACGVDANSTDKGGRTALMALQGRDPEIARMLLAAGASPHKALDACCMCSTVDAAETARVLAAAGATFAAPTESLKSAIYRGQIEIAEMILAAGEQVPKDLREQSREPGTQAFVIARGG